MKNVLVIGAGPTGLAAAAVLKQQGVDVRIVEKNRERSDKSRAIGVQAGTLECLERVLGSAVPQKMVADGLAVRDVWFHPENVRPVHVPLKIPSRYDFVLILNQCETERILEKKFCAYGGRVEMGVELTALCERGEKVFCTFKSSAGEISSADFDFVIACDGAHSTVRHLLQMPFQGGDYSGEFILGDVRLTSPWNAVGIHVLLGKMGLLAAFPMKEMGMHRLIMSPNFSTPLANPSEEITLPEFQTILSQISSGSLSVQSACWLTRFRLHHRMTAHFQRGNVFLAGDAAHIHSPMGGQGMNTGIQDAVTLACKIQKVISGEKPTSFLESYEKERLPVARNVLKYTDLAFRLALKNSAATNWFKKHLFPRIISNRWIQKNLARAISQVDVVR